MKRIKTFVVLVIACFCICAPFAIRRFVAWRGHNSQADPLSYWQEHMDERCEQIRSVMSEAGWRKSAFLWYTDAHWSYSAQKSPVLLKYLYEHTPVNKTFFGGDIVGVEGEASETMNYLWDWRSQIRDLPNHHSVPGNHDDGNEIDARYTDEYMYAYLLASEETSDVVRGEGLYYYIDVPTEKTRYLFLDTATKNGNIVNDTQQQIWLRETLLSVPDDWHIVAIAHIWRTVNYHSVPTSDDGFSWGGKLCLDEFDMYNARRGIYAGCKGRVEFCIGGHMHADGDFRSDEGIPVLITETDSSIIRSGLEYIPNTTSEASVNAVIADYEERMIHVIRIGRGESRTVPLD